MEKEWENIKQLLSEMTISANPNNQQVTIHGSSKELKCIGIGTDAAVFQNINTPDYAIKVFAEEKLEKIQTEAEVYNRLGDSPFFSRCFAVEDRFLVLSYESGITLYDCLHEGIHIPSQVIKDVEVARAYARNKGLNPRDIHLKNILLQNGRAKVIDVSEYTRPGNDFRWEHLKKGYEEYYHLIDGKAVPLWLLETIRKRYINRTSTIDEFIKDALSLKIF